MLNREIYPVNFGLKEGASAVYQVEQQISYRVDDYQYDNEIITVIKVTVDKSTATSNQFSVQMLKQWQLKNDGSDAADLSMAQLRKNLLVETDKEGNFSDVANLPEIKNEWLKMRPEIAKKYADNEQHKELINEAIVLLYTDGGLNSALQSSYLYHAIFPGLLQQTFSRDTNYTIDHYREIRNAIGATAIPFKTKVSLTDYNEEQNFCTIKIDGEIDRESFDQDAVSELFRELLDIYNLDAFVEGFHLESFEFGNEGLPVQSSQLTQYAIEGVLTYRHSCILTPLNN